MSPRYPNHFPKHASPERRRLWMTRLGCNRGPVSASLSLTTSPPQLLSALEEHVTCLICSYKMWYPYTYVLRPLTPTPDTQSSHFCSDITALHAGTPSAGGVYRTGSAMRSRNTSALTPTTMPTTSSLTTPLPLSFTRTYRRLTEGRPNATL